MHVETYVETSTINYMMIELQLLFFFNYLNAFQKRQTLINTRPPKECGFDVITR